MSKPTTGNPEVDDVVRERFTEAIGICRQMLSEVLPDIEVASLDRLSVALPMALTQPLVRMFLESMRAEKEK